MYIYIKIYICKYAIINYMNKNIYVHKYTHVDNLRDSNICIHTRMYTIRDLLPGLREEERKIKRLQEQQQK